jgi:hypothetical protein
VDQRKEKSYAILDKAFGPIGDVENYAIYFEGIARNLKNPLEIFSLPVYKIYRTGHIYIMGKKFEIEMGEIKALSDGKLMVVINEDMRSLVIDSLRENYSDEKTDLADVKELFGDYNSEDILTYMGTEVVNKKECHKIKAAPKDNSSMYVYYWVEVSSGKLLLMAEYMENSYDVYWIRKIGKSPEGYPFFVNVPKTEVKKLYGYEVFDMRFNQNE